EASPRPRTKIPWQPIGSHGPAAEPAGSAEPPEQADPEEGSAGKSRSGGFLSFLKETTIVLGIALVLSVLLKTFLIQAFFIPSESMQNTLEVGDRLIVNKLSSSEKRLDRGDVVVFVDPGGWLRSTGAEPSTPQKVLTWVGLLPQNTGEHLIKRIIGMPGDTVQCCDDEGRLTINGVSIDEPYVIEGAAPSEKEFSVTVPSGHLWL